MSGSFSKQTHGLNGLLWHTHLLCQEEVYRLSTGFSSKSFPFSLSFIIHISICVVIQGWSKWGEVTG